MRAASQARNRVDALLVAVALAVGVAGFATGARPSPRAEPQRADAPRASAPRAASYLDVREQRRGDNAGIYGSAAFSYVLSGPVPSGDAGTRDEALAARRARRAYEGAPPVVPHAVVQEAAPDCLGCHGEGAVFQGRVAPKISHERYASCVQCHVVSKDPLVGRPAVSIAENVFVGASGPARAPRAQPSAPPMIPHGTAMRTDCASCHGPLGVSPLRSPHLDRRSCQQCHAPSAVLDQHAKREIVP